MEKPRIVERITDKCAETRRRIGEFLTAELIRFDDNLEVPLDFDDDDYDLKPKTPEIPDGFVLGEK